MPDARLAVLCATLRESGADFTLIHQAAPIRTAQDAAQYYPLDKAARTLVLQTDRGLVAAIMAAAGDRLDLIAFAHQYGYRRCKLASAQKVRESTGYAIGVVPLVGHGLPCALDSRLQSRDYIYGGSGDLYYTLQLSPRDLPCLVEFLGLIQAPPHTRTPSVV